MQIEPAKEGERDEEGNAVVERYRCTDGTTITLVTNPVDGDFFTLHHPDMEYLKGRMQELLPNLPFKARVAH